MGALCSTHGLRIRNSIFFYTASLRSAVWFFVATRWAESKESVYFFMARFARYGFIDTCGHKDLNTREMRKGSEY